MNERPFDRDQNRGTGRSFLHGNGREVIKEIHRTTSESEQRDRQEEDWSIPVSVARRDDSLVRQELQRTPYCIPQRIDSLLIGVVWNPLMQGHHLNVSL